MNDNSLLWMDTWGWYALGDQGEKKNSKVIALYRDSIPGQIKTSDYILDEAITLLFRRLPFEKARRFMVALIESIQGGYVDLISVTSSIFQKAWDLRLQLQDKPDISFTDLTSFTLMKENSIRKVITEDQHFQQIGFGFELLP